MTLFDIEEVVETEVVKPESKKPVQTSKNKDVDIEKDYDYTRGNYILLLRKDKKH